MLEFAQIDIRGDLIQSLNRRRKFARVAMPKLEPFAKQDCHFVVGEVHDLIGVADERAGIAGDEVFALADADDQRAPRAGHDHQFGKVAKQNRNPVGPFQLLERELHRPHAQIRLLRFVPELDLLGEMVGDQVGDDLGIGPRAEHVAELLELSFEGGIVFDDAVVHQGDFAVASGVGMGVDIIGLAVGRPAGVPDAQRAIDRLFFQQPAQLIDPAGFFADRDLAAIQHGDARAVVAPVLQAEQPFQNQFRSGPVTDVSHDSAHNSCIPWVARPEVRRAWFERIATPFAGAQGRATPEPLESGGGKYPN
jgi:hypothetical protein